ncbi:MAG: DinB family protein [Syntrophomonadaceae bacterium]
MSDLGANLALLLTRELATFERELDLFPDDTTAWQTAPGVTNSAANLALHVAGNLQYYVGAVLGGSGYVRDRPREFSRRDGSREDVKRELRTAAQVVADVLPSLPVERFAAEYPEPVNGVRLRTDRFLMHLCSHAAYHLGQAPNARRAGTGDGRSSGPVALAALASPAPR